MNAIINWLNKHLVPVAAKIGSVRWLVALRDAFISIMPIMLAGSVASVLNAIFRDVPTNLGWTGVVNSMQWLININALVWTGSTAILGLLFAFTFGYHMCVQYKVEPIAGGLLTLGTFIMSLPQSFSVDLKNVLTKGDIKTLTDAQMAVNGKNISAWGWFNFNKYFGAYGFFTIMIMGAISVAVYIALVKRHITIKMPDSVPPAVSNAFTGIIPATAGLFVVGIIDYLFTLKNTTVIDLIAKTIQEPLMKMGQGYGSLLLIVFLVQLFWFFGIHGTNVLAPVTESIWTTALIANTNAHKVQKALPYMWTRSDFDLYVWIGGAGSTLLLILAVLAFSKREDERAVAKISLVPGIFNINEPMMFGMPIVLNPIYIIPFILAPLVMVSIAYGALSLGLVNRVAVQTTWAMPPFLNSIMATIDWRPVILQIVNMVVGFLIYVPFVIASNNMDPKKVNKV